MHGKHQRIDGRSLRVHGCIDSRGLWLLVHPLLLAGVGRAVCWLLVDFVGFRNKCDG